ncbi:MAG TPA: aldehyde dehydrogenase family protein, partial [Baekduia sp.]|nr:aldehyde dehydrogenase family protein [Baekduia sp.]
MATTEQPVSTFAQPGAPGSTVVVAERYGNFIGGTFVAPVAGRYRANRTPVTGEVICEVPDSKPEDVELALDAAHAAKDAWAQRSPAERAAVLNAVADAMEANLEQLAIA